MKIGPNAVAVTGIGVASPLGHGPSSLLRGLLESRSCLGPLSRFDAGIETVTVAEIREPLPVKSVPGYRLSRTDRLGVMAARQAVSQVFPGCVDWRETGIVMATTVGGLSEIESDLVSDPRGHYRRGAFGKASTYQTSQVASCIGADLEVEGPRLGVSVACASGAMAIALGARMILDGSAPMVLAGGSEALCAFTLGGFNALQALDPEPCSPFDTDRRGLNLGEGAAVVMLESLERARDREAQVLSILLGWGMSNDAHHPTAPHADGLGLSESMIAAMRMAEVDPEQIGYLNAHGTGTPLNDAAEVKGIESAFGDRKQPIPVSSTKSYLGHCLGAAGAIETVVTILSLQSGVLPPTLRLANPIESETVDWLAGEPRRAPLSVAMTASAGFGGSNTSLILGRAEPGRN
jgi:3-oxoacyl-[acyl-carrier-protein] synthase II